MFSNVSSALWRQHRHRSRIIDRRSHRGTKTALLAAIVLIDDPVVALAPRSGLERDRVRTSLGSVSAKQPVTAPLAKCFITNAPIANLFTVFARTSEGQGTHGISAFLVERGTLGLNTPSPPCKMGQHGSPVGEVILQNVRVPLSAMVGGPAQEGQGFRTAMRTLNKQRINLAGLCVGPAIRLVEEMVARAKARQQFGQAIGEFQLVQQMIAESNTEVHAARALVLETARKRDAGEDVTMEASMCKVFATEMCGRVADRAVQVYGGTGYMAGNVAERFFRDVRLFRLYEGTTQIHWLNIAKRTLVLA